MKRLDFGRYAELRHWARPRPSLRRQMVIGLSLAALIVLVAVAFFFWQLTTLRGAMEQAREENERLTLALDTAQQVDGLILTAQSSAKGQATQWFVDKVGAQVEALRRRREALAERMADLPAGDAMQVRTWQVRARLDKAIGVAKEALEYADDGEWSRVNLRVAMLSAGHSQMRREVDQLVALARERRAQADAQAGAAMGRIVTVFIPLVVIALAIAAVVAFSALRRIATGIERLSQSARRLAEGHFDERTPPLGGGGDELAQLTGSFNAMAGELEALYAGLERQVAERTAALARRTMQLEAAAQVAREAAMIRDVEHLLEQTVHLISNRFGFYHAGIFLLDERGEYVVLRAASSEGGQRMLARQHRLKVGQGIVGYAAALGQPRIALDVGADAVFFDNPDLPNTRSEMGLPLKVRDRVIGVLDVQSTQEAAFSDEDVAILQTMADQVALAIDNARLLEQSQHALRELEALYGRQVRVAWRERTAHRPMAYRYTGLGVEPVPASRNSEFRTPNSGLRVPSPDEETVDIKDQVSSIEYQAQDWPVIVEDEGGGRRLVAPIRLRRERLGSIVLREDAEAGTAPWSDGEIALVEELSTQIGLALENARLLEDTRLRAERERIIAEITTQVRASMDPETILQTAVRELGAALGTDRAFVRLGVSEGRESSSE